MSSFHRTGLVTRNNTFDLSSEQQHRRKICDAIAAASIVHNCAGVDTSQNRYMGVQQFQHFLEDYQEENVDDEKILELIQVRNDCFYYY